MSALVIQKRFMTRLFIYFTILLLIGLGLSIYVFIISSCTNVEITKRSIIGGLSSALVGSTVFYIRKLYKGMINKSITHCDENDICGFGTALYFSSVQYSRCALHS